MSYYYFLYNHNSYNSRTVKIYVNYKKIIFEHLCLVGYRTQAIAVSIGI